MNILGISAGFHDAGVALIDSHGDILYATHSERITGNKHDPHITDEVFDEISKYANIDHIAYYERPWLKKLRQLYSGEYRAALDTQTLSISKYLSKHCPRYSSLGVRTSYHGHHRSHAAAGFQTSPYDEATVVVIDAIGEWDTATIWSARYVNGKAEYTQLWAQRYPHSIGLFYSAITNLVGLKPMDEEYILMGMAAYGQPLYQHAMRHEYVESLEDTLFKQNLHIGIDKADWQNATHEDLAASAQQLTEHMVHNIMARAKKIGKSKNLVYMGGVALNCVINAGLGKFYDHIWIMPNPGDAGSSLGAAALAYGGKLNWQTAFLGTEIPGEYPSEAVLDELLTKKIVGVASGRAEFGPRALGNRSLLADPRGREIKDTVNEIKRRQKFRPFAPVILEEFAEHYFHMPRSWSNSRYMQCVAMVRHPDLFPAITHADGTARVQTVPRDGSGIRDLLEKWFALTDCPMLLNTSLNIRGEPMVDTRADADRFEQLYGVKVCS